MRNNHGMHIYQSGVRWHINLKFDKLNLTRLTCALNESLESIRTPRYLYSDTTCNLSPDTNTSGTTLKSLVLVINIHTVLEMFNCKQHTRERERVNMQLVLHKYSSSKEACFWVLLMSHKALHTAPCLQRRAEHPERHTNADASFVSSSLIKHCCEHRDGSRTLGSEENTSLQCTVFLWTCGKMLNL